MVYRISDFTGKSNNLSFIKFIAALMVIYHHSTGMLLDSSWREFGRLAVAIFFFASGYFVTKSLFHKPSIKEYFTSRFARIYPLFFTVIVLSIFVMGPIVSTLGIGSYFSSLGTYKHLSFLVFIPNYYLPGVFVENSSQLVNGSLWTLSLEVICYIILAVMFVARLLEKKKIRILFPIIGVCYCALIIVNPQFIGGLIDYIRPMVIFASGVLFYLFRDKITFSLPTLLIVLVANIVLILIGLTNIAYVICFPYLISSLIFSPIQVSSRLGELGKYSYSIFLIGYPIQQLISQYLSIASAYIHAVVSILIAVPVGMILYYIVEKPAAEAILRRR